MFVKINLRLWSQGWGSGLNPVPELREERRKWRTRLAVCGGLVLGLAACCVFKMGLGSDQNEKKTTFAESHILAAREAWRKNEAWRGIS